jgi:superfamily II DNA or RNA helicase
MSGLGSLNVALETPHSGGLRPYQGDAIVRVLHAIERSKRRIMLQAATGSGKTKIASAITEAFRAQDRRVIFVVPALELVDQTLEKFYREGIYDVGVMQADHWRTDWSKPVQIASASVVRFVSQVDARSSMGRRAFHRPKRDALDAGFGQLLP